MNKFATVLTVLLLMLPVALHAAETAKAGAELPCSVTASGTRATLQSPAFTFTLDTAEGLRAVSWENKLTGRKLSLGNGPEVELDIGLPGQPLTTPKLRVVKAPAASTSASGEAVFELAADDPKLSATVAYRWEAEQPVLRKSVTIANRGGQEWNRLLNVRLGVYLSAARPSGAKWVGFPVYLDDAFFLSLAHPSGRTVAEKGEVQLLQYPGAKLDPGKVFDCMEVVYGVAADGQARQGFIAHLKSRMRRVVRGHDKPYAIFDAWGAMAGGDYPKGDYFETEDFLLDIISKVAQGQRESGCHFDLFSVDFWPDSRGDGRQFDAKRFPNGFARVHAAIEELGTAPGLWIPFSYVAPLPDNPAVKPALMSPRGPVCFAAEPMKSMYIEAFRHHIRQNGVRLIKLDELWAGERGRYCDNPNHGHLAGIYSIEPIQNAAIEFYRAVDAECPDVFIMGYWGHRSPWWLLYTDTLFDGGVGIEASSPSRTQPAPYVRDSVTQALDQSHWTALENVPALGKDSLGIWLSDWEWNNRIGKERWENGFVMDICRGSMLAQPWSDTAWLSPPERKQMGEFIRLLKARPGCFGNSRFVLGNPWKNEPYGLCCPDGQGAFLAIHNACWKDSRLTLELNSAWGLPDHRAWDLYRWYPEAARLHGSEPAFGAKAAIAMRPFDVVLLEVVPHGKAPTLPRSFETKPVLTEFGEPTRSIEVSASATVAESKIKTSPPTELRTIVAKGQVPVSRSGGLLVVCVSPCGVGGLKPQCPVKGSLAGHDVVWEPVIRHEDKDPWHMRPWQAWRIAVEPSAEPRSFELRIPALIPPNTELKYGGYYLPK